LTPYGVALSDTNRVTIQLADGTYDLGTTGLQVDNHYVDIVGQSLNTVITSNDTTNLKAVIYHKVAETAFTLTSGYLTSSSTTASVRIGSTLYSQWAVGDWITVSGANEANYNGTFVIKGLNSGGGGTATYTMTGTATSPATGTITVKWLKNKSKLEN
jgi:hypothetical protein